jgi:hypothetical protein
MRWHWLEQRSRQLDARRRECGQGREEEEGVLALEQKEGLRWSEAKDAWLRSSRCRLDAA